MDFNKIKPVSRLKKKLLIYFILIAIVSISVSAEIILEISSGKFHNSINDSFFAQMEKSLTPGQLTEIRKNIDLDVVYEPVFDLRNRMLLFLLVVSGSIIGAFYMFTKDIISPMDGIVEATKKIARGDLTISVPVITKDEIGQIAGLINDMNKNLQDMVFQIKQEIKNYRERIEMVSNKISEQASNEELEEIVNSKKIRVSDFKKIINIRMEVVGLLEIMVNDLSSLQTYISMYKTYKMHTEISQDEIEEALHSYSNDEMI